MKYSTYFDKDTMSASKTYTYDDRYIYIMTLILLAAQDKAPYQLGMIYNIQQLLEYDIDFDLYTLNNTNRRQVNESFISFVYDIPELRIHISRRQFTLNKVIRG